MEQIEIVFEERKDAGYVRRFFERLTPDQRTNWLHRYEKLIAIEEGTLPTEYTTLTKKPIEHIKMPWMLESMRSGLAILTEVMNEKDR